LAVGQQLHEARILEMGFDLADIESHFITCAHPVSGSLHGLKKVVGSAGVAVEAT
jgi:hypothetical protein